MLQTGCTAAGADPTKPEVAGSSRATMWTVRFAVLGPLLVTGRNGAVDLGGVKPRTLLAVLLAHSDQMVPTDSLVEALWGDHPPRTAERTLQAYVARLRALLEPVRSPGAEPVVLRSVPGGYRLIAAAEDVDALRFETLLGAGRRAMAADPVSAAGRLREALGLWRGPAFGDLRDSAALTAEVTRLEALRVAALGDRIDADLLAGWHDRVLPEVAGLVRRSPYDERLWAQLAVATYRCGRQADALAACRRGRTLLQDELGLDPGPELLRLEQAILTQDPPPGPAATRRGVPLPPGWAGGPGAGVDRAAPLVAGGRRGPRRVGAGDRAVDGWTHPAAGGVRTGGRRGRSAGPPAPVRHWHPGAPAGVRRRSLP